MRRGAGILVLAVTLAWGAEPAAGVTTPTAAFQSLGIPTNTASPTPSAADLWTATPTPTRTPSPVPTQAVIFVQPANHAAPSFPVTLPSAPDSLQADFFFLSRTGQAAQPKVHLQWDESAPGSYVVLGYQVLRRTHGEDIFKSREGANGLIPDIQFDDDVEVGKIYDYTVAAMDAKGNSSSASQMVTADLSHLDPSLLAPRSPNNLTATSQRISVDLKWDAPDLWLDPVTGYKVFRSGKLITPHLLTLTAYEDISPPSKTEFSYTVESVDKDGAVSMPSLSVTAEATGTLRPRVPKDLTTTVSPEKVVLKWEKSIDGTAPVTEYLLTRIEEPGKDDIGGESRHNLGPLSLSQTSYSDSDLYGEHYYRYELSAVDAESNTSDVAAVRVWVPSKPFNKTSILLMPTAFSNLRDTDLGININVIFDLYIGALYESYTSPITGPTAHIFQPLGDNGELAVVTLDLKDSFIPETFITPGMAVGFYGSALIPFGGGSGETVAVSSSESGLDTLGSVYIVASKRLGGPETIATFGYMQGNLSGELSDALPQSWGPTIHHITPSGDYPDLFTRFLDPSLGVEAEQAPDMLFAGIEFPMTVPLGFTRWKTAFKLEVMAPLAPGSLVPDSSGVAETPAGLPLIWNFHFDRLPLFGFEFSIFEFQSGVEWIAFYHIPDLTWAF